MTHSPPKSNEGNSEIPRLSNKFGTECLDILQLKMNSLHFENDVEEEKIKGVCFAIIHGGWYFTFRNDYSDWSSWLVDSLNQFNCDHAESSLVKFGNAGIACEQSGGPKNNGHKTKCFLGFKMLKCTMSISACWESLGNRHPVFSCECVCR